MTERVKHKIVRKSSYEFLFVMFVVTWIMFSFLWVVAGWIVFSFSELDFFMLVMFVSAMYVTTLIINQTLFYDWRDFVDEMEVVTHEIVREGKKVR